jgi:hypothetical protein
VDVVLANVGAVVDGLEAHAKATGKSENEEGCEIFCKMFRDAIDDARRAGPVTKLRDVRDAAIRTYTMSPTPTGYLFPDLNGNLRQITTFASLKEGAVRGRSTRCSGAITWCRTPTCCSTR